MRQWEPQRRDKATCHSLPDHHRTVLTRPQGNTESETGVDCQFLQVFQGFEDPPTSVLLANEGIFYRFFDIRWTHDVLFTFPLKKQGEGRELMSFTFSFTWGAKKVAANTRGCHLVSLKNRSKLHLHNEGERNQREANLKMGQERMVNKWRKNYIKGTTIMRLAIPCLCHGQVGVREEQVAVNICT